METATKTSWYWINLVTSVSSSFVFAFSPSTTTTTTSAEDMTLRGRQTGSPNRSTAYRQSKTSPKTAVGKKGTSPSAKTVFHRDGATNATKDEELRDDLQATYVVSRFISFKRQDTSVCCTHVFFVTALFEYKCWLRYIFSKMLTYGGILWHLPVHLPPVILESIELFLTSLSGPSEIHSDDSYKCL